MSNHFHWNRNGSYGRILANCMSGNEKADDDLADTFSLLEQMRLPNNGSQLSDYDEIVKLFEVGGYTPNQGDPTDAQRTMAEAMFLELDSMRAKTSGGPGDTSGARAARDQAYNRFRG